MIWHIKRQTTKLKPPTTAHSKYCVVWVQKGHEADIGIMAHELTHVKQWWRMVGLFALLSVIAWQLGYGEAAFPLMVCGGFAHNVMTRFRWYRRYAEVEAFRVHVRHGRSIDNAAYNLARHYDLGISEAEAKALLV